MLRRLKIDPEFQSKIPPLTFEELNLLETNILEEGRILNPLIVWNGLIVDGHNRFAILKNHPEIKYTMLEKEFGNRYEAIVWICRNQLGRRNLTPEQYKYLIGQRHEAEKRAESFYGNRFALADKSSRIQNESSYKGERTREKIARENNTSVSFVQRAAHFAQGVDAAEEVSPGIKQEILSGSIKPTEQAVTAIAKAPEEERPALVAELRNPQKKKKAEKETAELPAAVKIDNKQLLEIAASRYHAKRLATGSDMLCEIEAAADNLKERWEQTFQYYPDLFTDPDNRAAVGKIVQALMRYLKEMEERTK